MAIGDFAHLSSRDRASLALLAKPTIWQNDPSKRKPRSFPKPVNTRSAGVSAGCSQQRWRDPSNNGSSNVLIFQSFSRGREHFETHPPNSQKSANARQRAQRSAKESKRALPGKTCKQPGLKQPGFGSPKILPRTLGYTCTLYAPHFPSSGRTAARRAPDKGKAVGRSSLAGAFPH